MVRGIYQKALPNLFQKVLPSISKKRYPTFSKKRYPTFSKKRYQKARLLNLWQVYEDNQTPFPKSVSKFFHPSNLFQITKM